jgi:hypothetical protein
VSMPEAGVLELQRALDQITNDPGQWDQSLWIGRNDCGTACCVAGRIVLNHPEKWRPFWNKLTEVADSVIPSDFFGTRQEAIYEAITVEDAATRLLGLDYYRAESLFDSENSMVGLWARGQLIAEGRLQIPEKLRGEVDVLLEYLRTDYEEEWEDA